MSVRPKKHLGQHFLTDRNIAQKIADILKKDATDVILEIGPGTGVLTQFLPQEPGKLWLIEIDSESVDHLITHFPQLKNQIIQSDFLKLELDTVFKDQSISIIGNFPYNISSQIVFKVLEYRNMISQFGGMFQKEVAQRICASEGSKTYGILSVLTQAFYETEYLFTVPPSVFNPPPKVDSGVIRLIRKNDFKLKVDERLFFTIVKTGFNQRRKTLRNSLKTLNLSDKLKANSIFGMRPEQLNVEGFIELCSMIEQDKKDQDSGGNQQGTYHL